MNYLKYIIAGTYFGIILSKSEVISWFRIQEMFRFHSFHMYGVIMSAIIVGAISILIIKKFNIRSMDREKIELTGKKLTLGTAIGGFIFGIGWAITGACPGPLYTQIGHGFTVVLVTLFFAIAGAWVYGFVRDKLPA